MKLTTVGSGDAFGSGGLMQTCFHVAAPENAFLIDCGATSLIGMQRLGLDPGAISTIFITHLHGDHFAGLIWWLIHAHYVSKRTAPLTVTGPAGIAQRFAVAAEALYPGASKNERRFEMRFIEYENGVPLHVGGVQVTPWEVSHPSGAPPYALRFEVAGKVIGFSGDTEWVENLIKVAHGADLFISECFTFDERVGYHMTWRDIAENLDRLGAKRVMITHMSDEMLARRGEVQDPRVLIADDGMTIDI